jgi:hypothetical protein
MMAKTGTEEVYVTDSANPCRELCGLRGLWQYLITRSQMKAKIEIERERNGAYADHRDRLPDNAELLEYEDHHGRSFWIRKFDGRQGRLLPRISPSELRPVPVAEASCFAEEEQAGSTTA